MTTEQPEQHPDDAAVAEVRAWVDDARYDEELIELEARTLRGVLAVLDGWKQNAETAAAQREAARSELTGVRAEMFALADDLTRTMAELEKLHKLFGGPLKATPDQWCAHYGVDIYDPDGWRSEDAPAWTDPIALPEFWRRASRSTVRNVASDAWRQIGYDARRATAIEEAQNRG